MRALTFDGDRAPMIARPRLHVGALPDFAHFQDCVRLGEVTAIDELLHALAADAQHPADFRGPYEVMHGKTIVTILVVT